MQNWQFWLSLSVAILALIVAFKAKSEAKRATDNANTSQVRNERNQFYPPLSFKVLVNDGEVRFAVSNESTTRDTTIEKVKFFASTKVRKLRADEEYNFRIDGLLKPGETREFPCVEFNEYLGKLKPMMLSEEPKKSSVFIRAWLESKPAIYECDIVRENLEATISHNGSGELIIAQHTR